MSTEIFYDKLPYDDQLAASTSCLELEASLYTPDMTSSYGCVTACSAFLLRLVDPSSQNTVETVDLAVGRKPDEAVSCDATTLYMLQNGLRVVEHHTEFERDWYLPYLRDEVSFEEQNQAYLDLVGEEDDLAMTEHVRKYQETIVKPQFQRLRSLVQPYIDSGQFVEEFNDPPSKELLVEYMAAGRAIQAFSYNDQGNVHAVALWRPNGQTTGMFFCPGTSEVGGSYLTPLQEPDVDSLNFIDASMLVVSMRQ